MKKALAPTHRPRAALPRAAAFFFAPAFVVTAFVMPGLLHCHTPAWSAGPQALQAARIERPGANRPAGLSLLAADIELSHAGGGGKGAGDQGIGSRNDPAASADSPRPGGLSGKWRALSQTAIARRVIDVGYWVVGVARLLWSIPKAIIQGDSRSLIEAIGDLLSRASAETPPDQESREMGNPSNPSSGEDSPGGVESFSAPSLN